MSSELAQIYDIGELVDVTQGLAINSKTKHLLRDEGLPLLRITDLFSGSYSQFVTQEGVPKQCIANSEELIYTRTGQVGFVFTNKVGVVHNNCFKVTPKDDRLSRRYLYWYLRQESVRSYVNTVASGSVQKDLNHSAFKTLKIPLLDLEAQRQIDSILSSLDDRITLLRETNATLEAIAQALFKSWFVDFDPVRAKMEGRAPEGMDEATAALFSDGFEASELGEVPKEWSVGTLKELLKLRNDRVQPSPRTALLPYVPIESISARTPFLQSFKSGEEANSSLVLFREGDVLFGSMRPYFHKVCSAPFDGVTRTTVFPLEPTRSDIRAYALFQAYQDSTVDYATQHSEGSTIPYAKWNNSLALMPIVLPPTSIQIAFSEAVSPFIQRANSNIEQAQTLATLRDTLLPRLISGQLRLPNAEMEATTA